METATQCSPPKISKSLLPAKSAYFFFYFSYSSVTPFIPVFITAYGLNAEQAGFILGARLFAQFLSGPCWGALADKTRRYKFLLLLQIVISSILTFTAPWIPRVLPETDTNKGAMLTTMRPITFPDNRTITIAQISAKSFQSTSPFSTNAILNNSRLSKEGDNEFSTIFPSTSGFNNTRPRTKADNRSVSTSAGKTNLSTDSRVGKQKNKHEEYETAGKRNIFILMIVWFALIGAFDGGIPLLIDNSVMNTIARLEKSDFGKQRLWGAVGFGLAAFASGVGIELSGKEGPNYNTMFYIFLGSNICLFVSCLFLNMKPPSSQDLLTEGKKKKNLSKGLFKQLKKFHVLFFFTTTLVMGMANGLLYGFMFLYIQDLQGSNIIMGLSILVACSTEVMMFPVSSNVIKALRGNLPSITLAFVLYVVRFMGFSYLQNAWFILLLQLLHSVCFALFWAAAVYHTTSLAPDGLQATFLGILNGLFFGIAGGSSSVFGGMVYNHFGGRNLFRGFAIVCAIWTVFLALHMFERSRRTKRSPTRDHELQENSRKDEGTLAAETLLPSADA